jgi:glycerophosphoryl diester phosphodiesterase
MLDRAFLRPIAHRGLHDAARGIIENTSAAFTAAINKGYGIECDLRPASDGTPFVFHDAEFNRLIDASGRFDASAPAVIAGLTYRGSSERVLPFAEFLDLVAGRVPLLVEIKSDWNRPSAPFMQAIAVLVAAYKGPLALMSFDPAAMIAIKGLVPDVPRGIVSGMYSGKGWWPDKIDKERAFRLSHLLESGPVEPQFFSYDIRSLPTPVTRFAREVMQIPVMAWTVRTPLDLDKAGQWADGITFEGFEP